MSLAHSDRQIPPGPVERVGYDLSYRSQPWYDAYMAALFEPDNHQTIEKLRSAERLMINREREIHNDTAAVAERGAIDKAFDALRALRLCLTSRANTSS